MPGFGSGGEGLAEGLQAYQNNQMQQQEFAQHAAYQQAIQQMQQQEFAQRVAEWNAQQQAAQQQRADMMPLRLLQQQEAQANIDLAKTRAQNEGKPDQPDTWGPKDTKDLMKAGMAAGMNPFQMLQFGSVAQWMHNASPEEKAAAVQRGTQQDMQRAMSQQVPPAFMTGMGQVPSGTMGALAGTAPAGLGMFGALAGILPQLASGGNLAAQQVQFVQQQQAQQAHAPDIPNVDRGFLQNFVAPTVQAKIDNQKAQDILRQAQAEAATRNATSRASMTGIAQQRADTAQQKVDQQKDYWTAKTADIREHTRLAPGIASSLESYRSGMLALGNQREKDMKAIDWAKVGETQKNRAFRSFQSSWQGFNRDAQMLEGQRTAIDRQMSDPLLLNQVASGNPQAKTILSNLADRRQAIANAQNSVGQWAADAQAGMMGTGKVSIATPSGTPSASKTDRAMQQLGKAGVPAPVRPKSLTPDAMGHYARLAAQRLGPNASPDQVKALAQQTAKQEGYQW